MSSVSIKIDDAHDLIISQSREPKDRGYGYDTITEVLITGPEGPYADNIERISNTKELALYLVKYFGG